MNMLQQDLHMAEKRQTHYRKMAQHFRPFSAASVAYREAEDQCRECLGRAVACEVLRRDLLAFDCTTPPTRQNLPSFA